MRRTVVIHKDIFLSTGFYVSKINALQTPSPLNHILRRRKKNFILVVDNLCLSFGQLVISILGVMAAYATPADNWTAPWAHNPHKDSRRVTRLV